MKIVADNISYKVMAQNILENIDIHISDKEWVGVVGPNGSGKSTFLKCVSRIFCPTQGSILLNDKPLQKFKPKESARQITFMSQHNHIPFDFTVMDIVLMGRSPYKKIFESDTQKDRAIAHNALEAVNMSGFEQRLYATLSGGEQKRVIVAQALTQQTPCIIMDEPTNHLDTTYQLQLMELIKNLKITVFSAIHDLNLAMHYCDRIYLLNHGKVVTSGSPEQVLTKERLRDIYKVEVEFATDNQGRKHILFLKNITEQGEL